MNDRELTFGQRLGLEPVSTVPLTNDMDSRLRNALWSDLFELLTTLDNFQYDENTGDFYNIFATIWRYFGLPVDQLPDRPEHALKELRKQFMAAAWFRAYTIVELIIRHFEGRGSETVLAEIINRTLRRENSGYRFIGLTLSPITSEDEAREVEEALGESPTSVATHLRAALEKLSDRENPDYRNSVHESVSAVESAVRQLTGDSNAMLSKALSKLKPKPHPALQQAFEKIYAYSSDEEGVRHSIKNGSSEVGEAEARFMVVACSAFVNYLRLRSGETLG